MRLLFPLLLTLFSVLLVFSTQVSALNQTLPDWYHQYQQNHATQPTETYQDLLTYYKEMQPSTERIYLAIHLQKLAGKLKQTLKFEYPTSNAPYQQVQMALLSAIQLAKNNDYTAAKAAFEHAINLSEKLNDEVLIGIITLEHIKTKLQYTNYHNIDPLISAIKSSLLTNKNNQLVDIHQIKNVDALVASHHGDYELALRLFNENLHLSRLDSIKAATLNNVALTLLKLELYPQAIESLQQALNLRIKLNNPVKVALVQLNLGVAYYHNHDYITAISSLKHAEQVFNMHQKTVFLLYTHAELAKNYFALGQYTQVDQLLSKLMKEGALTGHQALNTDIHLLLAELTFIQQKYQQAYKSVIQALTFAKQTHDQEHILKALDLQHQILAKLNKFEQAYQVQKHYLAQIKNSHQQQNNQSFKAIQKELITTKQRLHTAELEKQSLNQQTKINQLKHKQWLSGVVLFAGCVILIVMWRSRARLMFLATHDNLTQLLNRNGLKKKLENHNKRASDQVAFVLFDLDHFKQVNDNYGHPVGDRVLKETSALIKSMLHPNEIFARIGGEEFFIMLLGENHNALLKRTQQFREAIAANPITYTEQQQLMTSASFGYWYLCNEKHCSYTDFAHYYSELDLALYQAKQQGRNCVVEVQQ